MSQDNKIEKLVEEGEWLTITTTDGKELKTFTAADRKTLQAVYNDTQLPQGTHWYYWRVAQEGQSPLYRGNAKVARGHLAWSSPHWVVVV